MKDVESGTYRSDFYVAHLELPGQGDSVLLLTTSHILYFSSTRLKLHWELALRTLQGATIEDTGIRFMDKSGREYDRFVRVGKEESKRWFFGEIEK